MADNPFETASALVGDLRKEYQELTTVIPKLKETRKAAKEDLSELNRKVVDTTAKLDGLKEEIRLRTAAYNEWQQGEMAKLKADKDAFAKEKAGHETDIKARETKLTEGQAKLAADQKELTTGQEQLKRDRKDVNDQKLANTKRSTELNDRELGINRSAANNTADAKELKTRKQTLDQREQKIIEDERIAKATTEQVEKDRVKAAEILDNAKDSVAENDARTQSLDLREEGLNAKDTKLRNREIALNDREGVINSR